VQVHRPSSSRLSPSGISHLQKVPPGSCIREEK
jgi:hypothetical protein